MKIQDIASLEKAKTEIAKLTVDNENLRNGLRIVKRKLTSRDIMIKVSLDDDSDELVRLYDTEGNSIGKFVETKEDTQLFSYRTTTVIVNINLAKLLGLTHG